MLGRLSGKGRLEADRESGGRGKLKFGYAAEKKI